MASGKIGGFMSTPTEIWIPYKVYERLLRIKDRAQEVIDSAEPCGIREGSPVWKLKQAIEEREQ